MNEEREIQIASSLITLIDALSEKTKEAINSDNTKKVERYEETYDNFSAIAGVLLKSPKYHMIIHGKSVSINRDIRNYFAKSAEKSNTQGAFQEEGR